MRNSSRSFGLVMMFAIKNTNKAAPVNVSPLALRFGSSSGRRTITGSSSRKRTSTTPPVANSHTYPARINCSDCRGSFFSGSSPR